MNNLPTHCAAYDMDGNPILIENGVKGYYPFYGDVEAYNKWKGVDEEALTITCERRNGFLGGTSTIVVRVNGPEGIPNSETHCASQSTGALMSRDKANVAEFVQKFWMRVT